MKAQSNPVSPTAYVTKNTVPSILAYGGTDMILPAGNAQRIKAAFETVLCAFERAGIEVPARCHTGECGFCRSKLVSGKVYIPEDEDKRRIADMQFNFIHPCRYPESDLVVRIN